VSFFAATALCLAAQLAAQPSTQPVQDAGASDSTSQPKRILGIIPNFRTAPLPEIYKPLTPKEKFKLATQDAFDRGTFALAAVFAGEGQRTNSNPSFGQGVKGYGHYFVTSYADWAGADYMTEAIYPTLLHQDPRFFRKGQGSGFRRLTYAMSQIFWTRTDSGGHTFNVSEVGGNATMVAISQAYYPGHRSAGSAGGSLATQVGDDMASNILKEFYPDLVRLFSKKHSHP
jgi:hypothetical protein